MKDIWRRGKPSSKRRESHFEGKEIRRIIKDVIESKMKQKEESKEEEEEVKVSKVLKVPKTQKFRQIEGKRKKMLRVKRIKRLAQLTDTEDEIEECDMSTVRKSQKVTAQSSTTVEKSQKSTKKDGTYKKKWTAGMTEDFVESEKVRVKKKPKIVEDRILSSNNEEIKSFGNKVGKDEVSDLSISSGTKEFSISCRKFNSLIEDKGFVNGVTWYFLPRTYYYRELIKFNLQHRITDCLHTVDQLIGAHELSNNQLTNYNNPYLGKTHFIR